MLFYHNFGHRYESMIPFNKPYLTGKESEFVIRAFNEGKFSGNGYFTKRCHTFFKERFGFNYCLLTNSATAALEMAAILCNIKEGDEVILPSYTFVSTANPFAIRGAKLVFCDSRSSHPNIDEIQLGKLITPRTKAIIVVHYAGMACNMEAIKGLAEKNNIYVIEDAAHAITSQYKDQFLGTMGHFAAFSFHETKNISCGQGGMLVINDDAFIERAKIVWANGTNRLDMEDGMVSKYEWLDHGSNFYPSEITAALLYAQLEQLDFIQERRKLLWNAYFDGLKVLDKMGKIHLPKLMPYQSFNYHIFYLCCSSLCERDELIAFLKSNDVLAVFHYLPLHISPFILGNKKKAPISLPYAESYAEKLVRLPLFVELKMEEVTKITALIMQFYS